MWRGKSRVQRTSVRSFAPTDHALALKARCHWSKRLQHATCPLDMNTQILATHDLQRTACDMRLWSDSVLLGIPFHFFLFLRFHAQIYLWDRSLWRNVALAYDTILPLAALSWVGSFLVDKSLRLTSRTHFLWPSFPCFAFSFFYVNGEQGNEHEDLYQRWVRSVCVCRPEWSVVLWRSELSVNETERKFNCLSSEGREKMISIDTFEFFQSFLSTSWNSTRLCSLLSLQAACMKQLMLFMIHWIVVFCMMCK